MEQKTIIYQVLPRLFGNDNTTNKENGTIEENGSGKFSSFTEEVLNEIVSMGFNHVWYTGVIEHASKTDYSRFGLRNSTPCIVKGSAGSPYAIRDYYDVSPDLADDVNLRMQEFESLVSRTKAAGLKVIIDFIPNHIAREYFSDNKPEGVEDFGSGDDTGKAFHPENNFYYLPEQTFEWDSEYKEFPARASGNDCFTNRPSVNDWYETVKLNYGVDYFNGKTYFDPVPDTWHKMKDILLFWTGKGIDGFRCDMAEMVPVEFWRWVIPQIKQVNPSIIFIAEIYKPQLYWDYVHYGHFDYLYDKVGLYDTLRNIITGSQPASDITHCWQAVDGIQRHLLNFIETHDEQRIASDFFIGDPMKALPAMIVSATMNTNPVLVYAGQELGEKGMDKEGFSGRDGRTTIFDYWCVKTLYAWRNNGLYNEEKLTEDEKSLRKFYTKLLRVCNEEDAIRAGRFYDLMYMNYQNPLFDTAKQYAFFRHTENDLLLVITNFGGETTTHINIEQGVFEYIEIRPEQMHEAVELLTGEKTELAEDWVNNLQLHLPAHSGKILKFY